MSLILLNLIFLISTFLLGIKLYPMFIKFASKISSSGQPIYAEALPSHLKKVGTPTMGGVMIVLITVLFSSIFYKDGHYINILSITLLLFGSIGFLDDFLKLKYKNIRKALSPKIKMLLQILSSIFVLLIINKNQNSFTVVNIAYNINLDMGFLYYFLAVFIIVGSSNAFNLTDGLDGLAIFPFIVNCVFFFTVVLYYNYKSYDPNIEAMSLSYCAIVGSSLSFLWFNTKKADIFMGDSGSLSLGAFIGVSSIILKCEVPFIFSSMIFVIEALSVILQVGFFKITKGKRLFLIAPIHHHFEKLGIEENKIVVRSWIFCILTTAVAIYLFFSIKC